VGELQADIRVEVSGGDFVEQVVIKLGAGAGFVGVADILAEIIAAAARMASATSVPATKRADVRWPKRECSAMARSDRLSDNAMKIALNMMHLIFAGLTVAA
jgi:hypothetical protein